MSVWPFLMALSGAVFALSLWSGRYAITTGAILGAYCAGRIVKNAVESEQTQIVAFALIWACVAALDAIQRQVDTKTLILSGVALCYFVARVLQSPWVFGSWPFVASDLLAVAAMLLFAWGSFVGILSSSSRVDHLGGNL